MIKLSQKTKRFYAFLLLVLCLPYFGVADGGPSAGSGCSKKNGCPNNCGPLTYHDARVYLRFDFANYPGRVCVLPEPNSDPALVDGTIIRGASNYYWAQIFIEPLCSNGTQVQEYWIRQDANRSWPVKIPDGTPCKITVQFFETINNCSGYLGRPYFEYVGTLSGNETSVDAYLNYIRTY